jgi:hypothetical protein
VAKMPFDDYTSSPENMFFWSYKFHDTVNHQINEANKDVSGFIPHASPSFAGVASLYSYNASNPNFFGRALWRTIHSVATTYVPSMRDHFSAFMNALARYFPFNDIDVVSLINEMPFEKYLSNRDDLLFWTYKFHDAINKRLNVLQKTGKISPDYNAIKKEYVSILTGDKNCESCKRK